jgi:hypothetical protein
LCNWGGTLKQSSAVHIQALVSADVILLGSSSKHRLLAINLASVPGRQLVNSPTAKPRPSDCEKLRRLYYCYGHLFESDCCLDDSQSLILFFLQTPVVGKAIEHSVP